MTSLDSCESRSVSSLSPSKSHAASSVVITKSKMKCIRLLCCTLLLALVQSFSIAHTSTPKTVLRMASETTERRIENVLFIECGFGNDSHGQSATKAAVRACRNAIEFNSIPSIKKLVPGGYDGLLLDVVLAVPAKYRSGLDLEKVKEVFPYGAVEFQIQDGGMIAPSGIAIDSLGDKNDDMVVVCAAVTVGF